MNKVIERALQAYIEQMSTAIEHADTRATRDLAAGEKQEAERALERLQRDAERRLVRNSKPEVIAKKRVYNKRRNEQIRAVRKFAIEHGWNPERS